jgi:hypothetical protein
MAARIAMIAMTTSSSINVKARENDLRAELALGVGFTTVSSLFRGEGDDRSGMPVRPGLLRTMRITPGDEGPVTQL